MTRVVVVVFIAIVEEEVTLCGVVVVHEHGLEQGRLMDQGVVLSEVRRGCLYTRLLVALRGVVVFIK